MIGAGCQVPIFSYFFLFSRGLPIFPIFEQFLVKFPIFSYFPMYCCRTRYAMMRE